MKANQQKKLASAEFHQCCNSFQTKLRRGKLAKFSTIGKGSHIATTTNGNEIKGIVISKPDKNHVYIDYEDRNKINRKELCVGTFNFGEDDDNLPTGSTWFKDAIVTFQMATVHTTSLPSIQFLASVWTWVG